MVALITIGNALSQAQQTMKKREAMWLSQSHEPLFEALERKWYATYFLAQDAIERHSSHDGQWAHSSRFELDKRPRKNLTAMKQRLTPVIKQKW